MQRWGWSSAAYFSLSYVFLYQLCVNKPGKILSHLEECLRIPCLKHQKALIKCRLLIHLLILMHLLAQIVKLPILYFAAESKPDSLPRGRRQN